MAWAEKCGNALTDLGTPLGGGKKIGAAGITASNANILGYSMLQAENIDEVMKLFEGHPHLSWSSECEIEVYESQPIPGM